MGFVLTFLRASVYGITDQSVVHVYMAITEGEGSVLMEQFIGVAACLSPSV